MFPFRIRIRTRKSEPHGSIRVKSARIHTTIIHDHDTVTVATDITDKLAEVASQRSEYLPASFTIRLAGPMGMPSIMQSSCVYVGRSVSHTPPRSNSSAYSAPLIASCLRKPLTLPNADEIGGRGAAGAGAGAAADRGAGAAARSLPAAAFYQETSRHDRNESTPANALTVAQTS